MVQTELKFVRLMEELDDHRDEISDLAGEHNSITDGCAQFQTHDDVTGNITPDAQAHQDEIDVMIEDIDRKIFDICKQLGLPREVVDETMDSCIVNRWEIYAHLMGAEIVSLVDIANGRA